MSKAVTVLAKQVNSRILIMRERKVILDSDLAELFDVEVRHLNQQVKRNIERFPQEFMFRLSLKETNALRSQFVISNHRRGGRRYLPYAFTEHGAIMAATVLNSERAIQMSVFVVRAFVRMREALAANQQIVVKLGELERRLEDHDGKIHDLIHAIRDLMVPAAPNRRKIGFQLPAGMAKPNGRTMRFARNA